MRYFLIAGEASGDLHGAALIRALSKLDPEARFQCYGGDAMAEAGAQLLCHYRDLAYMGFIPVLLHLRTILRGMKRCKQQIEAWRPDVLILIDYPGFNLKIARYVKRRGICPIHYYIAPKIWAWKEGRIKAIRRDIDALYSILPFEPDYFRGRHGYDVTYVGNPTVDEIAAWRDSHAPAVRDERLIALLPGSRTHEIKDNLQRMLRAAMPLTRRGYRLAIAAAPAITDDFYAALIDRSGIDGNRIDLVRGDTFALLDRAGTALVTSGTATLETAIMGVPQVVCYYVACGRLVSLLRRLLLKVKYVSLVNLVCGREVVTELVADGMTPCRVADELALVLPGGTRRAEVLAGYDDMRRRLGQPGAPERAAEHIRASLKGKPEKS
ncbi:MAG: lipid-A-disaccharide synthase [Bacteroidales bacterium]|nr:lipid-A-disaccharide synthase [Bacteroidales bacterium]